MAIKITPIRYIKQSGSSTLVECELIQEGLPWNDDRRYCVVKLNSGEIWGCKDYGSHWEFRERLTSLEPELEIIPIKQARVFTL